MKLRAEKELQGQKCRPQDKAAPKRAITTLLAAVAVGAVLTEGCTDCPVAKSCNANDFDITLAEGETKGTVSNGIPIHVQVLQISESTRVEGAVCRVYGGGAQLRLTIDSDPPFSQDIDVSPSMCFSVVERCVAINNAEVTADVEIVGGETADGGITAQTCVVSNEKVSFTLTIGQ